MAFEGVLYDEVLSWAEGGFGRAETKAFGEKGTDFGDFAVKVGDAGELEGLDLLLETGDGFGLFFLWRWSQSLWLNMPFFLSNYLSGVLMLSAIWS